ncbi:NAD(P)-dependent dehydrogenase, short-chain alcohol dehydrogenase family [Rhizobium sp. RU20A]|uniref:SDR family NAD(P)-dependent oxidoreductase n=1 Tax=Rhizobium sp. RU20A TaxID=1907412 RepID=UPI000953F7A5|nr:SDR family oxidoreductase [Rhizobium sp. RU20A]SIR07760.1 NAD(P)-dependent dehydrogenase, short-chain alcohol dehydrogenase family [Rhizobium sp. RU20A]
MPKSSPFYGDLAGKAVLVTGGASGIGASLVGAFCGQGARVGFLDIDAAAAEALIATLAKGGHTPAFLACDLRDAAAVTEAVTAMGERLGGLDILVNNAARDDRQDIDALTPESWDESQAVNLRHFFFAAQAALPFMRAAGGGAIVNFSSIAYLLNMGDIPAYATAKAGIVGLTRSLAGRLGPENIRVNCILPGMIVTERQKQLWLTEQSIARMVERQCLKRALAPQDLVGPCLFLASSASGGMTAQSIIVDGGAT